MDDLYSLIKFLGIQPFDSKASWSQYISKPVRFSSRQSSIGVSRLQTLMKSITLRRTKDQTIDGKPILNVPPRHDHTLLIELNEKERATYSNVNTRAKTLVKGLEKRGMVMKHYVHILEMILRLRQLCNHSDLIKNVNSQPFSDIGLSLYKFI